MILNSKLLVFGNGCVWRKMHLKYIRIIYIYFGLKNKINKIEIGNT